MQSGKHLEPYKPERSLFALVSSLCFILFLKTLLREQKKSSVITRLELIKGLGPPLLKLFVVEQSHSINVMVFPKSNLQP